MTLVSRVTPRWRTAPHLGDAMSNRLKLLAAVAILVVCSHSGPAYAAGQAVGQPVPDVTFETSQNETIRTGDLKGDVVFVYFWAADCKACVAARTAIERLAKQFGAEGVWFLSVDEDARQQFWKDYLFHNPSPMIEVRDENRSFRKAVRIARLPAAFVADKSGQIRWRSIPWSAADEAKASAQMASLLQEPKPK
jgi:peroxiredoxin